MNGTYHLVCSQKKRPQFTALRAFVKLVRLIHNCLTACGVVPNVEETAAEYDTEVLLPKIPCPVLLLQADVNAGGLMTDADIDHALKLLPKPTHIRLSDVSHALLRNQYKEPVLAAINTFLASI
jgi:pimeloyl-ACP methyl ester carboxylesterase